MTKQELVRRLKGVRLMAVRSTAVQRLGYDLASRMAAVQFTGGNTVYGYPGLADDEIEGWLKVMQDHGSIGEFISKTIKPNHDDERVSYTP
jgi:hypothetical protein